MKDCPRVLDIWLVTMRATTSLAPPGGNGTITVIDLDGYSCARAVTMPATSAIAMTIEGQTPTPGFMTHSRPRCRAALSLGQFQYLRDLDPASLPRRENAGAHHRERFRRVLAPDFVLV